MFKFVKRGGRILLLLCLLTVTLLGLSGCQDEKTPLRAVFLDIGQGDSILLLGENVTVLIDTGDDDNQALLLYKLKEYGVKTIDLLVITHPDADHLGGADGVLENFDVGTVWFNAEGEDDYVCRRIRELAEGKIKAVCMGERFTCVSYGVDVTLSVLMPQNTTASGNDACIVLYLTVGNNTALFTGDAEEKEERELVSIYNNTLKADLMKAGHHGSDTSNSEELLSAVGMQYAVVSCGYDNPYGHPTGTVLKRFEAHGATVYRTDLRGDIIFDFDGENIIYREEK